MFDSMGLARVTVAPGDVLDCLGVPVTAGNLEWVRGRVESDPTVGADAERVMARWLAERVAGFDVDGMRMSMRVMDGGEAL